MCRCSYFSEEDSGDDDRDTDFGDDDRDEDGDVRGCRYSGISWTSEDDDGNLDDDCLLRTGSELKRYCCGINGRSSISASHSLTVRIYFFSTSAFKIITISPSSIVGGIESSRFPIIFIIIDLQQALELVRIFKFPWDSGKN